MLGKRNLEFQSSKKNYFFFFHLERSRKIFSYKIIVHLGNL